MAIQTEPTRIQIPFADSGTKNVIPDTNSTPSASQAASWTDGFPAQCSLPLSAGGIPPARADFNGLFNTMSQSIRYGQEGGIWAWDATVDYGTNRLVLGSDGLLYWSIAQSGPNVGGAQDPTTDTGVYWSTMPMLTPPLGDTSNKGATTEWVKNLAAAPVYVDPAGSDANDGFSAATAVATLSKAVDICSSIAHNSCKIVVAAGTYSENLSISKLNCEIELTGNVSLSGGFVITDNSFVVLSGSSYSLNVSGDLSVYSGSVFDSSVSSISIGGSFTIAFNCYSSVSSPVSISSNSVTYGLRVSYCSMASFSNISISGSPSESGVYVSQTSAAVLSTVNLNITSANQGVSVQNSSYCLLNNISITSSAVLGDGIAAGFNSVIIIGGTTNTVYGTNCIVAANNSFINIGSSSCSMTSNAGCGLYIFRGGSMRIDDSTAIEISCSGTGESAVLVSDNASLVVNGSGNFITHGTYSDATMTCSMNGSLVFSPGRPVNISSNPPNAKKFLVKTGGQINVGGAGINRFSGTLAGVVESSSYGYYG